MNNKNYSTEPIFNKRDFTNQYPKRFTSSNPPNKTPPKYYIKPNLKLNYLKSNLPVLPLPSIINENSRK